jgi:hypothetical protein
VLDVECVAGLPPSSEDDAAGAGGTSALAPTSAASAGTGLSMTEMAVISWA